MDMKQSPKLTVLDYSWIPSTISYISRMIFEDRSNVLRTVSYISRTISVRFLT